MEDKAKITKALLPVLQMTRNFDGLINLEYVKEDGNEKVIATYNGGYTDYAVVNWDSGTALITDVIKQLLD